MVDKVYGSAPVDWFVQRLLNLYTFILAIVYYSAIFWVDLGPLICQGYTGWWTRGAEMAEETGQK